MNIHEAYLRFLEKVTKNYTNDNIEVDRGRFIPLFNEKQNNYVEWILEKRNEDEIREIQKLLVYDEKLKFWKKELNHQDFKLPLNYFSFTNIQALVSTDSCKNQNIKLFEIKQEDREEILFDENNEPSFKYRETFYSLGEDSIKIYVKGFEVSKVFLTYYRYPVQVDIEGYINSEGNMSQNIDPEFDDKIVDRILTACAKDFNINSENLQRFQFDKDRLISKI